MMNLSALKRYVSVLFLFIYLVLFMIFVSLSKLNVPDIVKENSVFCLKF